MDARIRYTKKVIRESFLELLKENPVGKISVKSICDLAEVNRATFYKYYDNPLDLLCKIEDEILNGMQEKVVASQALKPEDVFVTILTDISDRRDLYLTLFSENGDGLFRDRCYNLCYDNSLKFIRTYFPDMTPAKQELLYSFLAGGCSGILNKWTFGGMNESPEEIASFTAKLIDSVNATNF